MKVKRDLQGRHGWLEEGVQACRSTLWIPSLDPLLALCVHACNPSPISSNDLPLLMHLKALPRISKSFLISIIFHAGGRVSGPQRSCTAVD